MSAWSKAHNIKNDEILFLSDDELVFSKKIGWTIGSRTARYAIVLDKGIVTYAEKEERGALEVSFCFVSVNLSPPFYLFSPAALHIPHWVVDVKPHFHGIPGNFSREFCADVCITVDFELTVKQLCRSHPQRLFSRSCK
jgi:hypothetical protein